MSALTKATRLLEARKASIASAFGLQSFAGFVNVVPSAETRVICVAVGSSGNQRYVRFRVRFKRNGDFYRVEMTPLGRNTLKVSKTFDDLKAALATECNADAATEPATTSALHGAMAPA